MEEIFKLLGTIISTYQSNSLECFTQDDEASRFVCDATILGSLLKSCSESEIWPALEAPYENISFDCLATKVWDPKIYALCDYFPVRRDDLWRPGATHSVKYNLQNAMKNIEDAIIGLDLDSF